MIVGGCILVIGIGFIYRSWRGRNTYRHGFRFALRSTVSEDWKIYSVTPVFLTLYRYSSI